MDSYESNCEFVDDICYWKGPGGLVPKSSKPLEQDYQWPDGVVPYIMDEKLSPEETAVIMNDAIKTIEENSCVRFVKAKGNEKAFLNFVHGNVTGNCWATLGKKVGEQKIYLPSWCIQKPHLLHEIIR